MSWRADCARAAILVAICSAVGLAANLVSPHPLRLFRAEAEGPSLDSSPGIAPEGLRAALARGEALLLLDVREDEAYRRGHPRQAFHAPASRFIDAYGKLNLGTLLKAASGVVVLCDSADCSSADHVARQLRALGHPDVRVFDGGWRAYVASGLDRVGE